MRVLSLLTQYSSLAAWRNCTTSIDSVDPRWEERSLVSRALLLVELAPVYDVVVIYQDVRLPVLFWLLACLRFGRRPATKLVFVALLCDVSQFHTKSFFSRRWLYEGARRMYYKFFTRIHHRIVVHSSAEVELYARVFGVPRELFWFVPFHVRPEALTEPMPPPFAAAESYMLCAGRHRDIATFCAALSDTSWKGILVCGAGERAVVESLLPPHVSAYFELPKESYRALIAHAQVLVIPLYAARWQRSLGQIAAFEAIAKGVPVIAAGTMQLADYFCAEQEIFYYEPENAADLKRQIDRVGGNPNLAKRISTNAYFRMSKEYTAERYVRGLLAAIDTVS